MKELECPKCGGKIAVDEADYAFILQQVRSAEFDAEINRRLAEIRKGDDQARQLTLQQQKIKNAEALRKKDDEISALSAKLQRKDDEKKASLLEEELKSREALAAKDAEIAKIRSESELKVKAAQEQVEFYRDMKAKLSTKMIGESLEVHCSTLFNQTMRTMLPQAYFEKDNEVVDGTKGDFVNCLSARDHGRCQ